MATTTPNYGWDVPTSTDYVKDGATAIETLGDDIDATLFSVTGGKNVGLVLLNTTTVASAAASISVDNVFTSAYTNYRIVANTEVTSGVPSRLLFRFLRASDGAASTATNYFGFGATNISTNGSVFQGGTGNSNMTIGIAERYRNTMTIDLLDPFNSVDTGIQAMWVGSNTYMGFGGGYQGAESERGFRILFDSGTFTGTVRTYGYRNA